MHQLGVRRRGNRLLLHGRVDDHLPEVRGLGAADPSRDGQALLDRSQEPRPDRLRRPAPALVVERFFAWIGRNRHLAKDFEATLEIRPSLPLRRLHHAAHPTARAIRMSFEFEL